jgi:hypothetical protein
MADRITQRLIAAGASPERAAAFSRQFAAARPGLRPKEIQDAFDAELGAFSAAQWPYTFKPQTLSDAELNDYVIGVYGQQKFDDITRRAAPNLFAAKQSSNPIIKAIAQDVENGVELTEILDAARGLENLGNLTIDDVVSQTKKIYSEFGNVNSASKKFLEGDKYYKANLPHPNLKYGTKTDLRTGTVDFKTNPKVKEIVEKRQEFITSQGTPYGPSIESSKESIRFSDDNLLKSFQTSKATPFFDEVTRREFLKKKTTLK